MTYAMNRKGSGSVTITISSPNELRHFASFVAATLRPGDVIGLVGDLGAGKTVFAAALARALGVRTRVVSPTFVIAAEHRLRLPGFSRLYHFDLYRLSQVAGHDAELFADALADRRGAMVIEWADRAVSLLARVQKNRVSSVCIIITGELTRRCTVTGPLSRRVRRGGMAPRAARPAHAGLLRHALPRHRRSSSPR